MLDQLFTQSATIARHRAAPVVGPYLDEFVGRLAHLGYRTPTIRQFLGGSEEFGRFLFDKSVQLADVTNEHAMSYLALIASESPGVVLAPGSAPSHCGAVVHIRQPSSA